MPVVASDVRYCRRCAARRGGLALDTALIAPDRVAGLVLLGTAVSGVPEPQLDPQTQRFDALLDAALAAGNSEEVNRLEDATSRLVVAAGLHSRRG